MDGNGRILAHDPLRVLICALGGEGGGVLTGWIVAAARAQGLAVQATSVPGVAQRTGGTTYYIEMAHRDGQGRAPVFALTPVPGQIDVVLASELSEGARAARMGLSTPDRTSVIASTHRVFLIQEKMAMGDGRIDPAGLEETMRARSRRATFLDMDALAQRNGVPISPVMLGALAGAGALPIERAHFEKAIEASGIAVQKNLAAFAAAFAEVSGTASAILPPAEAAAAGRKPNDFIIESIAAERADLAGFNGAARDVVARGIDRLTDYQDAAYADLYRKRLEPFRARDPELLREVARHLALRMSYEDVIRVAQHKARPERYDRIRGEVGSNSSEPFEVLDFFKPGVREFADIMPPFIARAMLRLADRNATVAKTHVGMRIRTTTILGYLRVWMLAKLRPWRRRTYRYQIEQRAIESWLSLVSRACERGGTPLAREVVELARLIKGYGETHERGSGNYARIVELLVEPALNQTTVLEDAPAAIRAAREAALADPEGKSLDATIARVLGLKPLAAIA